jgi:hypothetical protein
MNANIPVTDTTYATFWRRLARWLVDDVPDKAQQVRDGEARMFARLRQPGFTFEEYLRSRRGG